MMQRNSGSACVELEGESKRNTMTAPASRVIAHPPDGQPRCERPARRRRTTLVFVPGDEPFLSKSFHATSYD